MRDIFKPLLVGLGYIVAESESSVAFFRRRKLRQIIHGWPTLDVHAQILCPRSIQVILLLPGESRQQLHLIKTRHSSHRQSLIPHFLWQEFSIELITEVYGKLPNVDVCNGVHCLCDVNRRVYGNGGPSARVSCNAQPQKGRLPLTNENILFVDLRFRAAKRRV